MFFICSKKTEYKKIEGYQSRSLDDIFLSSIVQKLSLNKDKK